MGVNDTKEQLEAAIEDNIRLQRERDDLAAALKVAEAKAFTCWPAHDRIAQLEAASPRVVSTVAELDALPTQSVVMDGDGQVWRKSHALWDCLDLNGDQPREESRTVLWQSREPRATVLWVGGTDA